MVLAARLNQSPSVPQAAHGLGTLMPAGLRHLFLKGGAVPGRRLQLFFELVRGVHAAAHLAETLLDFADLTLQGGKQTFLLPPARMLPGLQAGVCLGEGGLFVAAGHNGLNPFLQLGTARHGDPALFDEGTAAENLAADAGQQLAAV